MSSTPSFSDWKQVIWPPRAMPFEETVPFTSQFLVVGGAAAAYLAMVHLLPVVLSPIYKSSTFYRTTFVQVILRPIMVLWNAFLAIASGIMFAGVFLPVLNMFLPHYGYSVSQMICDVDNIAFGAANSHQYWVFLFVLSKVAELLDTLFLIVKNPTRPVEFLHWYHHTTVLLFCWYAWHFYFSAAVHFMVMNALIHTFMYTYYCLKELGFNPSWNKLLTKGQIAQMFGGCALVGTHTYYHYVSGRACTVREPHLIVTAALIMYASYLGLFLAFYFKRYNSKGSPRGKQKASKDQ